MADDEGWEARMAARTPRTPERYHADNHHGDFEGCWRCQRSRAICRSKRAFGSREDVDAAVREINEARSYEPALVRYRCRWCLGWHMATATHKVAVKRAEKQRRKWVRRG